MIVHIYQIHLSLDKKRVCFMPCDAALKEYGGIIPSEIYQHVYQTECDTDDPEEIFEQLNLFHPADYRARSLSVSDVVEYEKGSDDRSFYYCDVFGFREIDFDRSKVIKPEAYINEPEQNNG